VFYREEFLSLGSREDVGVRLALTRAWPGGWDGHRGRVTPELLRDVSWPPAERPLIYICGPTAFVEAIAGQLVDLGHDPSRIRTERFGPTGS
jgi:ferredoxin-NADP reductase